MSRSLVAFASCLVALTAMAQPAEPLGGTPTPAQILNLVSAAARPEIGFRESRRTRLLKAPILSSGRLRYAPSGRLERETREPVVELVVIEGRQVTIDRAGSKTELSLIEGSPQEALVQTLRAILGGRAADLDALYTMSSQGNLQRWTLLLEPRSTAGSIRSVRLTGSSGTVQEIEVQERSGDKTLTTLVP